MSVNQSRGDKNELSQQRRSGRSGNPASQRNFSGGGGGGGKGGAGGGSTSAPPSSSSFYSGRSFKKVVSNAQGAQTRVTGLNSNVNLDPSNSSSVGRAVQNGAHIQPPSRGPPNALPTGATVKSADAPIHKSTPGLPKAPQGSAATGSADASRAFPLQFGSINPGVMNGMQVPARTNSAPPNLDEQKRAQARLDSLKATAPQNPTIPKQQSTKKDVGPVDEAHSVPREKKDGPISALVSAPPAATHYQKPPGPPVPPVSAVSMQMPFHQSQIHLQFGGPNMQSQGVASPSLPMLLPMHLPVGNPSQVQQQVFVPGIQHHQGIIHQSQGLTFSTQMGHPQLGNMGLGLGPQYPQQQMASFGGQRRTVKITHPDTREELKLDKRTDVFANGAPSGPRPHPHGPPQAHAMNYYPSSYTAGPHFFPSSNPLTTTQTTPVSQAPRLYNQVTVKPAVGPRGDPPTIEKAESPKTQSAGGEGTTMAASSKPSPVALGPFQPEPEDSQGETVSRPGPFKEEPKNPVEKSSEDVVETSKKATPTTERDHTEDSKEQTEEPKAEVKGSKEQTEDGVDRIEDSGVPEVTISSDKTGSPATSDAEQEALGSNIADQEWASPMSSGPMDKTMIENKGKGNLSKGRKRREILKNADAQGMTSDLYMAYKRPEEKKETLSENVEGSSNITLKQASDDCPEKDDKRAQGKFEPDDWEDAADISTPELEPEDDRKQVCEEGNDGIMKKYSRDFLLKFSEHCTDLPEGFEVTSDIAEVLIGSNMVHRDSYSSPGKPGPRLDRRLSNVGDDDKRTKPPGPMGYPGNVSGFRPNYGVLRNPRGPIPVQYAGGILSGPIPSPGSQRNNSDSDRWQRATGYQKGLIPSPHTPMMHKAERKYEVGKITDEEQAKQRQLKGILNKLTPQNFEILFEQVNIDNAGTLSGVIAQIFDKALTEPTFVEMYANFCSRLAAELPDFTKDNQKITFKRLLLNKCQEEFERGEREQEEANRAEQEGEAKLTEEEREEKRVKARRRMLGNIRLIGELYKKKMLTERIMHECIKKLLGQYQSPDEEDIEALCKLMSTIGEMIDHPNAKEHMDVYFDMMFKLSNNMELSLRVRFMLKDVIDLRKNRWQQRRKVEGPKKIEEVHRDAAQERQAQTSRLARGPNPNMSTRRGQMGQHMEFGPRGPVQMGGFRGLPHQLRGYGGQDPRFDDSSRHTGLSRPIGDEAITLGPQGGLARGMSARGMGLHEPGNPVDPRRVVSGGGPNGHGLAPERVGYGSRDGAERFVPQSGFDHSNVGRGFDRVQPASPPPRARVPTPPQSGSSDTVLSEDRLRDLSIEAIKEYYSARDEKEVVICIKELNAPSFYPSMISIWVTDSFERKDMERDSLVKLLINLTKSQDAILSQDSLLRGFESVLSTLEDAVNDAPKAAEFLGRMFATILMENVIPYKEVWRLIYQGGEEQGRLVEIGLAAEVLGVILEVIESEKGYPFLNDLRSGSSPRLENFRPANIKKSLRLDKFILDHK